MTMVLTLVCVVGAGCAPALGPLVQTDPPVAMASLKDPSITEASGLVASRKHPGYFYVHNDSGDRPRVFLIDRQGRTWVEIRLRGADAKDYEDITLAPGSAGQFDVCVADIGDNHARRASIRVYRFPEVDLPAEPGQTVEVAARAVALQYPEGPADAETFLVHPHTGHGYVITKRVEGGGTVYRLPAPWPSDGTVTLTRVADLELPAAFLPYRVVTGGDISPDGTAVVLRCYADGWFWSGLDPGGGDAFEGAFSDPPTRVDLADEAQGEAVCFTADGRALLTVGEGQGAVVSEVRLGMPTTQPH